MASVSKLSKTEDHYAYAKMRCNIPSAILGYLGTERSSNFNFFLFPLFALLFAPSFCDIIYARYHKSHVRTMRNLSVISQNI